MEVEVAEGIAELECSAAADAYCIRFSMIAEAIATLAQPINQLPRGGVAYASAARRNFWHSAESDVQEDEGLCFAAFSSTLFQQLENTGKLDQIMDIESCDSLRP